MAAREAATGRRFVDPADRGTPQAPPNGGADNEVALESLSQWQLARRRFRKHRLAMIGVFIFLFMVLVAIFGPILGPTTPRTCRARSSPAAIRRPLHARHRAPTARAATSSTWSSTVHGSR